MKWSNLQKVSKFTLKKFYEIAPWLTGGKGFNGSDVDHDTGQNKWGGITT